MHYLKTSVNAAIPRLYGLGKDVSSALKPTEKVRSGQAGNIARAQVQRDENGGTSGTLRRLYVVG